jgi:TPP-dependent pyruvate/acetoin dehydrogenase alpha subunit
LPGFIITEPITEEYTASLKKRDPIVLFRDKLLERKMLSAADAEQIDKEVDAELDRVDKCVMAAPLTNPETMFNSLYAE